MQVYFILQGQQSIETVQLLQNCTIAVPEAFIDATQVLVGHTNSVANFLLNSLLKLFVFGLLKLYIFDIFISFPFDRLIGMRTTNFSK